MKIVFRSVFIILFIFISSCKTRTDYLCMCKQIKKKYTAIYGKPVGSISIDSAKFFCDSVQRAMSFDTCKLGTYVQSLPM